MLGSSMAFAIAFASAVLLAFPLAFPSWVEFRGLPLVPVPFEVGSLIALDETVPDVFLFYSQLVGSIYYNDEAIKTVVSLCPWYIPVVYLSATGIYRLAIRMILRFVHFWPKGVQLYKKILHFPLPPHYTKRGTRKKGKGRASRHFPKFQIEQSRSRNNPQREEASKPLIKFDIVTDTKNSVLVSYRTSYQTSPYRCNPNRNIQPDEND